jgi:exodeoxyribonuclease VII small subunit
MPAKKKTDMPLEKILERLDEISVKLDSDLPLDEALSLYEEGIGLIKSANKIINDAEIKIRTLDPTKNDEDNYNDNK